MNCSTIRPWLFKRLDGELRGSEQAAVETHLASCSSCLREWRLLSIPKRIGETIPALEPSPFFYQKLRARLQGEAQSVTMWQIILGLSRYLVPGLAAITLAMLSVFVYFQLHTPPVDISQTYESMFWTSGDRPQRIIVEDQNEITDESVLSAIAEEESARK
jgi:hypothetical protein